MLEDSGNGPAVPVDDQSHKHKKETDRHEITHLPVEERNILMAECNDEFPTGLHGSCQNNKQYAKTKGDTMETIGQNAGCQAEKKDRQAVHDCHGKGCCGQAFL